MLTCFLVTLVISSACQILSWFVVCMVLSLLFLPHFTLATCINEKPPTIDLVADSKRGSGKKIRSDMISRPQNDLRHTGHIGYDGAIFGDVGFIGDNYDKLPVKVSSGIEIFVLKEIRKSLWKVECKKSNYFSCEILVL